MNHVVTVPVELCTVVSICIGGESARAAKKSRTPTILLVLVVLVVLVLADSTR